MHHRTLRSLVGGYEVFIATGFEHGSKRRGNRFDLPGERLSGRQREARHVVNFSTNYNAPNPHQ